MIDREKLKEFDANQHGEDGFCNECIADDRREDHDSDCDCYCHEKAKIKFLGSAIYTLLTENEGLKSRNRALEKVRDLGKKAFDNCLCLCGEGDCDLREFGKALAATEGK